MKLQIKCQHSHLVSNLTLDMPKTSTNHTICSSSEPNDVKLSNSIEMTSSIRICTRQVPTSLTVKRFSQKKKYKLFIFPNGIAYLPILIIILEAFRSFTFTCSFDSQKK